MLLLPKTFGPVTLQRKLGTGSLAEAYLGTHVAHRGRRVIVRRVLPWVCRDTVKLAQVEQRVGDLVGHVHPLLVRVLDHVRVGDERFVIEEVVEGTTLERVIATCRQQGVHLPPHVFLHLAVQTCNALEALHGRPGSVTGVTHVLHQALKPGAVYVNRAGQVHLGSFGLGRSPVVGSLTAPVPVRIEYLAPEQTEGETPLTPATDVFSLAAMLYELATLEPLFRGDTNLQTLERIRGGHDLSRALARLGDRVPGLAEALRGALETAPQRRTQRASMLRDDLRAHMSRFTLTSIASDTVAFLGPLLDAGHVPLPMLPPEDEETSIEEATNPNVARPPDEREITAPGDASPARSPGAGTIPLADADEDTREQAAPPPVVIAVPRPTALSPAAFDTSAASMLPEPRELGGAAAPSPLVLPRAEEDTFDGLRAGIAPAWAQAPTSDRDRPTMVRPGAGMPVRANAPSPDDYADGDAPSGPIRPDLPAPLARGPAASRGAPAGLGGLSQPQRPAPLPGVENTVPVVVPDPQAPRNAPPRPAPVTRSGVPMGAVIGLLVAIVAGTAIMVWAARSSAPAAPVPAPPQLIAVLQPAPKPVEMFKTMRVPSSGLTWGEIHERAWRGALSREDVTVLQAVTQPPESTQAHRYLLTDAEARGDTQAARRALDTMLANESLRNNPELLAIDARLRANAGDRAGAAAAAAAARTRLETLDEEAHNAALAHVLCVEAVLAQATLAEDPGNEDLRRRARDAWSAVATHARTTGHPELDAVARAGSAAVQGL
jgi:serine/threonine protein kinase